MSTQDLTTLEESEDDSNDVSDDQDLPCLVPEDAGSDCTLRDLARREDTPLSILRDHRKKMYTMRSTKAPAMVLNMTQVHSDWTRYARNVYGCSSEKFWKFFLKQYSY